MNNVEDGISKLDSQLNDFAHQRIDNVIDNLADLRAQNARDVAGAQQVLGNILAGFSRMQASLDRIEESHEWSTTVNSSIADELKISVQSSISPLVESLQSSFSSQNWKIAKGSRSHAMPSKITSNSQRKRQVKVPQQSFQAEPLQIACGAPEPSPSFKNPITDADRLVPQDYRCPTEAGTNVEQQNSHIWNLQQGVETLIHYEKASVLHISFQTPLGYFYLSIDREIKHFLNKSSSAIRVHLMIVPKLKRALKAHLLYHKDQSSLTNIRIFLPRILSEDDPLVLAIRGWNVENALSLFKGQNYGPNDEVNVNGESRSLLYVSYHSSSAS